MHNHEVSVEVPPALKWAIFCVLAQQLLIALSNVFLAELAMSVVDSDSQFVIRNFLLFFASIAGSYLPWLYANVLLSKAISGGFARTVASSAEENFGNIEQWRNREAKEGFNYWLSKELYLYYEDFCHTILQLAAIGSNVIFSVVALSALIDYTLAAGYILAVSFSFLVFKGSEYWLSKYSNDAQRARNALDGTLHSFWDNVLIGNKAHYDVWQHRLTAQSDDYVARNVAKTHRYQLTITFSTYLAYIPVFAVLLYHLNANLANPGFLASLSVLLVRNLNVLNEINGLVDLSSYWIDVRTRKQNVDRQLKRMAEVENLDLSTDWISFKDLSITFDGVDISENKLDIISNAQKGRVTVMGPNGSGKTAFLIALKAKLADNALLIPAESSLVTPEVNNRLSTGQRKLSLIEHAMQLTNGQKTALLLDEWNANLDNSTSKSVQQLLDQHALANLVVEAIHRTDFD